MLPKKLFGFKLYLKTWVFPRGQALGYSVRSTIPAPRENVAVHATRISFFKLHQMHHNLCSLYISYYCTNYIDNYSNTASGIPACLGLFVDWWALSLISSGIFIANPSLSGIWLSLLYLSVAF